jgi:hypothetical protein
MVMVKTKMKMERESGWSNEGSYRWRFAILEAHALCSSATSVGAMTYFVMANTASIAIPSQVMTETSRVENRGSKAKSST